MNYEQNYLQYIEYVKTLARSKSTGYYEEHHVLPRSLGGDDQERNLVLLTPREHFLAHYLLTKIYPSGEAHAKMVYAFNMMACHSSKNPRYINSRIYAKGREEYAKLMSEKYKIERVGEGNPFFGKNHSQKTKEKISLSLVTHYTLVDGPFTGHRHSVFSKEKMSKARKGNTTCRDRVFVHKGEIQHLIKASELESYLSQGYVRGMSDATRKKMSENSPIKGIGHTLATRQKMSKNSVGKNLGKKRTAEQRAERSRLQTGKVWVNDGKLTTSVRPEEAESLVSKGWLYGRLRASEETKKKFTELRTGRVWVNDGTSQRFVTKGEAEVLLSDGFVMGRGKMAR